MVKIWIDHNGNYVLVTAFGGKWITVLVKRGSLDSVPLRSPLLPPRETKEKAQRDLDEYATARGWKKDVAK